MSGRLAEAITLTSRLHCASARQAIVFLSPTGRDGRVAPVRAKEWARERRPLLPLGEGWDEGDRNIFLPSLAGLGLQRARFPSIKMLGYYRPALCQCAQFHFTDLELQRFLGHTEKIVGCVRQGYLEPATIARRRGE
jgi:hypothetical protein